MSKDELIKILEEYEMFVDDDFGGSYESIIAYAPNKTISRAHTPIAVLNIIDTFEKIQQENQKYKEVINKMKTNLDSSINAINKKLSNNKFRIENGKAIYPINDYCVIRLKGIRTKCKELLKILNEVEHE